MSITNLKILLPFLEENGVTPQKKSSQNFLIDKNIVRKTLQLANACPEDFIIEIGPGPGALTESLLSTGCQVLAIEKDPKLAALLGRFHSADNRLQIACEDFLTFPIESFLPQDKKAKVIANLPYHITTPILAKLLPLQENISDLVIMVQKEVADRCLAKAGSKDYSSLTLFLNYHATVHYGFTVAASCFYPRPKVDSAVIHLLLHPPPAVSDPNLLFEVIRKSFQQRRKMLKTSLKEIAPSAIWEQLLNRQGLNPLSRPEEIDLHAFIALVDRLSLLRQTR